MFTKSNKNGINKNYNNVEAIEIYDGLGKNNSCHISQTVETVYPAARMGNEFSTGLFDSPAGKTYTSKRYSFVPVPKGYTKEQVQERLNKFQEGCIYRILTNNLDDILTEGDMWNIRQGNITREDLENKYEVQDSEGKRYACGVENTGQLPKEFKRDFYNQTSKEDIDKREHKSTNSVVQTESEFSMQEVPAEFK